ncbi:ABC transporter ATP-binding protein [Bordetella genomosp. 10]|uniref:ABC transporter ATP-binding protein n=1 Tax=Bordetella genomosp. 10 TaxID=1416804 RepID=A0A261S588_9BORD|nr:ABC transporter ATP-binding protein [Bordetella genomosp. 10]OZI32281.1 ABC transporter ATP-binding protein [Bordetella genomosp. 10]
MKHPVTITLEQCAKTWPDGSRALHPVDLRIEGGRTLALLGPSGCGKTTLLRLICGLEAADAGSRIYFDDEDVSAQAPEARGVGVVFQNYALFPNMTVAQNVAYGLRIRKWGRAEQEERVRHMLGLVRMEALADRRISQLSGGQRQRVALARALAIEPRVLLLDEPLTALDAKLREHLRVELAQMLRSLHITTVIVTHDQDEAMMLGDRIAVMSAGRLEQVGDAETLYRQPATPFVGEFLGTLCKVRGRLEHGVLTGGGEIVAFRPHEVELLPALPAALHARIASRFFLGATLRLQLELDDGQAFPVTLPADCPHRVGESVSLRLTRPLPA